MITESMKEEAERQYGELVMFNGGKDKIIVNEQGFAKLYVLATPLVYIPAEKAFYYYNSSTGLWQMQSKEELLDHLGLFLHEYAEVCCIPLVETKRNQSVLSSIIKFLSAICREPKFFHRSQRTFIHCANGVLELDEQGEWGLKPFSPDYHSRNRCEISYAPGLQALRFLGELLNPLVEKDDVDLLQQYIGQCLTGKNITQSILLLTGSGGSGKGTLANIVEKIVGDGNFTQIRPENIIGRFETSFFMNKTLLTGKESKTSFFTANGMSILKSLVGDDTLRVEIKNSNQHEMIDGVYNVFIVGNPTPFLEFESNEDRSAWYRRLRWVKCKNYKPAVPIADFAGKLIAEEGPGILNWALAGAKTIILSGSSSMPRSELQAARLDYLFSSADPLTLFLSTALQSNRGTTITGDELFAEFTKFSLAMEWQPWSQREFQKQIHDAMIRLFQCPLRRDVPRLSAGGKFTNRAGFYHVKFKS